MERKETAQNYRYSTSLIVLGLAIIGLSIMILINKEKFWMKLFDLLGWLFLFGAIRTWISYYKHREAQLLIRGIINTLSGVLLILFPEIPAKLSFVLMALYITANGVVQFISYITLKDGNVNKRLYFLVMAIFLIFIGLSILVGQVVTTRWTMIFLGTYGLLLGLTYIGDGIASVLPQKKKEAFKRKIRVSAPLIVTALMPRMMLEYINEKLAADVTETSLGHQSDESPNIEILLHVTEKGFGAIGHCDISIKGRVFSYANYDNDTFRFFDSIGDGVLAITDRDTYIPFCLKESEKTIFSYGICLSDSQMDRVETELEKLMQPTYEWRTKSWYNESDTEDYASKLYIESNKQAKFFKFTTGEFKTYFVLGANCVEVVEVILGRAGMDIIRFNGIVSPGAYQDYLEKEFHRNDGIVISKNVYRPPTSSTSKFSLLDIMR